MTPYRFHFSETPQARDVAPGHVVVSDADLAEPPFRLEDLALVLARIRGPAPRGDKVVSLRFGGDRRST